MSALLFPGQGSQVVGMGSEFYSNFDIVKKIFKEADEKLNYPISKLIFEGPEDKLQLTENTQPAILTVSYSIFRVLKDEFGFELNAFKFFAGHSLGEYTALVCSDSLNFNDALYLLHERGIAMQEAVPVGKGSMIAVLGTKFDETLNCEEIREGLPADWIKLEKYGIVDIVIRKLEIPEFHDSDRFKEIKDHFKKRIDGLLEKLI